MANCEKCGAEKVLNPKTQKWFCKEKCWTKQQGSSIPTPPPNQALAASLASQSPDWGKINAEKNGNIKWLNALNNAGLAFANGKITKEQIEVFANWFYELEPNKKNQPF